VSHAADVKQINDTYCTTCLVTESANTFAKIYHICCNVAKAKKELGCNGQHAAQSSEQTALAHNGEAQKLMADNITVTTTDSSMSSG
jgi:hypothetical protein